METTMTNSQHQAVPAMCYTRTIDRKPYVVRVFFRNEEAETMQQKIERMLRYDMKNMPATAAT